MTSVADWSTTAASNTSVDGLTLDGNVQTVSNLDNIVRGMMKEVATSRDDGTISNVAPRGYIYGLTCSNNVADATNDLDIAAGVAAADTSPYWKMTLASAITKRLDANWAVGTGQGGLDTGTVTNGLTYHVWLIQRSDTLVTDILFSTSATAPTMPANYDRKRRIWSIRRESNVIMPFFQRGDVCLRLTRLIERNSTAAFADALVTLNLPLGIVTSPILGHLAATNAASFVNVFFADGNAAAVVYQVVSLGASAQVIGILPGNAIFTNTSAQVRLLVDILAGTLTNGITYNYGWVDTRGQLA